MHFRAITATLKLRTPLHVGSGQDTETVDDLLRRDASGRLLIPGTALAGALRSIATRLAPRLGDKRVCLALRAQDSNKACGCLTCQLFGDVNPQEDDESGNAARLLIYDALFEQTANIQTQDRTELTSDKLISFLTYNPLFAQTPDIQIRDGVGIDRVTGAAARRERSKFTLEVLSSEVTFQLRIELDPALENNKALKLLAATLAEWKGGRAAIGGRVSRGLGAFCLDDVKFIERDLNDPIVLMNFLRHGPPWDADGKKEWLHKTLPKQKEIIQWSAQNIPVAHSWVLAEFTLAATGPFLTHDIVQAARGGFNHAPWLAAYSKKKLPIVPGSTLRGVLRSQAERIARTVATYRAWEQTQEHQSAQKQFFEHCPACNPLTTKTGDEVASCNSFIKTRPRKERDELERFGADDKLCPACLLFGSSWNGSRLRIEDAPLKEGTRAQYKVLDFVAIDRFTGGGRDSAKFDAVVLWKPQFRVRLFLENPQAWELGWLALTLRDIHDGFATVGFGRSKGFGRCEIVDRKLTFGFLHDSDFPLPRCGTEVEVTHSDEQKGKENEKKNATYEEAVAAGEQILASKATPSGIYQTVLFSPENQNVWLALANGWVQAFNDQIKTHKRHESFPFDKKTHKDSYFMQKSGYWLSELYPVEVSA